MKKQVIRRGQHVYTYYRLVESYRDTDGKVRHQTIRYLGRLDDEAAAAVRRQLREGSLDYGPIDSPQTIVSHSEPHPHRPPAVPGSLPLLWRPVSFTTIRFDTPAKSEWMVADRDTLLMIGKGSARVTIRGHAADMDAQQILFCPEGAGFHIGNAGHEPLELFHLVLQEIPTDADYPLATTTSAKLAAWPSFLPAGGKGDWSESAVILHIQSPAEIRRLCGELNTYDEHSVHQPLQMLRFYRNFYELLHLLCMETEGTVQNDHLTFEQMIQYVQTHYRENLRRDELARQMGVTPEHFSRLFRSYKGCSFSTYLSRVRLNQARLDFQLSQTSTDMIARRCGYSDVHYFSRKFKQQFGLPPSQYRTSLKQYAACDIPLTSMLLYLGIKPAAGYLNLNMLRLWQEHFWPLSSAEAGGSSSEAQETKPYLQLSDLENLPTPSSEWIQTIQPDLLFAYEDHPNIEQLNEYVPVQQLALEHYNWREQWLWLAERVQRQHQAQAWLQSWDTRLEVARQDIQSWLSRRETVGIYKIVAEKVYVYGNLRSMGGPLIYDGLGCEAPESVQQQIIRKGLLNIEVPLPQLDHYAADHMIVIHYPVEHQNRELRQTSPSVMNSSWWNQLPAVQAGKVYMMDPHIFYGFDPFSQELQLDRWLQCLASYLP
ncbi:helix-turn-helix domain-containing protein [Paenibacillus bovis]|uniref:helix-turn-helix domain-containing protein n=1 Tax=Paenibacillus bovis TaxID=1616788 RepID=UPI0013146700|nr:helix-turn-helix domain-containing protein [Paenibacillus bovis]